MKNNQVQEQINKPERLHPIHQQTYRNKLYFEDELRKLVPDLVKAENFGLLEKDESRYFNYYTSGEPNIKHSSYFYFKNGLIEFTGILRGDISKSPIQNMDNLH